MKTRFFGTAKYAAAVLSSAIPAGLAQTVPDGGIDGSFQPTVGALSTIEGLVTDLDGGIIATGSFTQIKDRDTTTTYQTRYRVAKFSQGGVLQAFAPVFNSTVLNASVEPDGSQLYVGQFLSADSQSRRRVARYLPNGTLDPSFNTSFAPTSPFNSVANLTTIYTAARQGDSYIMASNVGIFRTSLTGAEDSTFKPYYSTVFGVNVMPGKSFLINGPFVGPAAGQSGVNSWYLERLAPDGTVTSPAFTHALDAQVYCAAVQADGRILVGGQFGGKDTTYKVAGLTRLMSNGEPDTEFQELLETKPPFDPFFDGAVRSIAIQADGRILVAGDFTSFRNAATGQPRIVRRGVARLFPNGSLDTSFDAKIDPVGQATPITYGVSLQGDGKILIHGEFVNFNGATTNRPKAARLLNYAATQSLTYQNGVIRWERGGSSPEARFVTFEHKSPATNFEWKPVDDGHASRENGTSTWIKTPATPFPENTLIRAFANVAVGKFNAGTSTFTTSIGYKVPKIGLSRTNPPADFINNGTTSFSTTGIGTPADVVFTVNNAGEGEMTNVVATLSGANASEFSALLAPDATIPATGTTPMVIRFNPTSTGTKTAILTITSSDPFTPTFKITLTATAITALEHFRMTYFGSTANSGNGADDQDPDGDGLSNYFEFVAGLIPTDRTSTFSCQVVASPAGTQVIYSPCFGDRTYEVLTNTTVSGQWTAATGTTTSVGLERTLTNTSAPDPKRFYRLKITKP